MRTVNSWLSSSGCHGKEVRVGVVDVGPHRQSSQALHSFGADSGPHQHDWEPSALDLRSMSISTYFPPVSEVNLSVYPQCQERTVALLSQVLWARLHGGLGEGGKRLEMRGFEG